MLNRKKNYLIPLTVSESETAGPKLEWTSVSPLFLPLLPVYTHKRTHIHPQAHRYESVKYALLSVFSGNTSPTQTNKTNTDIGFTKVVESLDKRGLFHSGPCTGLQHLKDCSYLNVLIIDCFCQTNSVDLNQCTFLIKVFIA